MESRNAHLIHGKVCCFHFMNQGRRRRHLFMLHAYLKVLRHGFYGLRNRRTETSSTPIRLGRRSPGSSGLSRGPAITPTDRCSNPPDCISKRDALAAHCASVTSIHTVLHLQGPEEHIVDSHTSHTDPNIYGIRPCLSPFTLAVVSL